MIDRLRKTGWMLVLGLMVIITPLWLLFWLITGIGWDEVVEQVCEKIDNP